MVGINASALEADDTITSQMGIWHHNRENGVRVGRQPVARNGQDRKSGPTAIRLAEV